MRNFKENRRQKYISEESYIATLKHFERERPVYKEFLDQPEKHIRGHAMVMMDYGLDLWREFQIRYTAGEDMAELAKLLEEIVESYDRYVEKNNEVPEEDYLPPFRIFDDIDTYVDFLDLICSVILLHREELLLKIFSWIKGSQFDGSDAVLEEILNFYFSDRPSPDDWFWDQPYRKLIEVIDAPSTERPALMKKYVKAWYPAMKGKAFFWGKHEEITPEFSPYFGYWAMCAAVFTYLLDIDDTSYRDEEVYPKDLVDYARSRPRCPIRLEDGMEILRVEGGQTCPKEGTWFSPAKADSARHFKSGERMPVFDASEYGQTIWQWVPNS